MTVRDDHPTQTSSRRLPLVVLTTFGVALGAWVVLAVRAIPIPGHGQLGHEWMGHGLMSHEASTISDPGVPEGLATANGLLGAGGYLLMWGVMMIAMMYPASAWLFQSQADANRFAEPRERHLGIVAFVGSYTLVWIAIGVVPIAVDFVVSIAAVAATNWSLLFGGALVVLAAFQLSPTKRACLERCRTTATIDEPSGLSEWARSGWRFGVTDLRACWALMGLMVVVGSMNIRWMAAITAILVLERNARWGYQFARGVGITAGVAGVLVILLGLG